MNSIPNQSEKILIAFDGSSTARHAAEGAITVAQQFDLEVNGLYVVDETLIFKTYEEYQNELGSDIEAASNAQMTEMFQARGEVEMEWLATRCLACGVRMTSEILFGGVPELILDRSAQARFITLGRRGHGHALDPDHLGKTFHTIAYHARCPLWVGGDIYRPIKRILIAYNGGDFSNKALKFGAFLASGIACEAIVLSVEEDNDPQQKWSQRIETQLEESSLKDFQFILREGQPGSKIIQEAEDKQVDLILLGGHHYSAIVEWIVGSNLDFVLRNTSLPVLIARE